MDAEVEVGVEPTVAAPDWSRLWHGRDGQQAIAAASWVASYEDLLELEYTINEGDAIILEGGYLLKSMLKMIGFSWNRDDKIWKLQVDAEHTEESIRNDLTELVGEWGFTLKHTP